MYLADISIKGSFYFEVALAAIHLSGTIIISGVRLQ